jgi:hypothetical protein
MAFISNNLRTKLNEKINHVPVFKKFFVFISLITVLITCAYSTFGLLAQLNIYSDPEINKILSFVSEDGNLTTYGIIFIVILSFSIIGTILSLFFVLSFPSPKKITKINNFLINSPISGEKKHFRDSISSQSLKRKTVAIPTSKKVKTKKT